MVLETHVQFINKAILKGVFAKLFNAIADNLKLDLKVLDYVSHKKSKAYDRKLHKFQTNVRKVWVYR